MKSIWGTPWLRDVKSDSPSHVCQPSRRELSLDETQARSHKAHLVAGWRLPWIVEPVAGAHSAYSILMTREDAPT